MRLAVKIFLANAFVILVVLAVAVWSIAAITKLSVEQRTITVRTAEGLGLEVAVREAVVKLHRLELRGLVFADAEHAATSQAEATRITEVLQRLRGLLRTDEERARLEQAIQGFAEYRTVVERARDLLKRGATKQADEVLGHEGGVVVDRVVVALGGLVTITQEALDRTQVEATAALGHVRNVLDQLRVRTFIAIPIGLALTVLAAVAGTAIISIRMTRSLRQLSEATTAVAEGQFLEPLTVRTKDEVGALARAFNVMGERLRQIDAMKEQFYATMSHELRSPLMSIREAARLMHDGAAGQVTEKQERLLAIIDRGGDRLLRLVSKVLDLSRADAGLLPLDRRWFDLGQAVARAIDEMRPQAMQRQLALKLERPSGEIKAFGDEDRIVEVVVNLVANALRLTPPGGSVTVRVTSTDAEALIEVEDTGAGIRPDLLPVIFDRFRQAHSGHGGTGLGLALVRAMVEAHGGRVVVESQEGKGSRFTVVLPRDGHAASRPAGQPRA
jgi:signal transduction histidine kinase